MGLENRTIREAIKDELSSIADNEASFTGAGFIAIGLLGGVAYCLYDVLNAAVYNPQFQGTISAIMEYSARSSF